MNDHATIVVIHMRVHLQHKYLRVGAKRSRYHCFLILLKPRTLRFVPCAAIRRQLRKDAFACGSGKCDHVTGFGADMVAQ